MKWTEGEEDALRAALNSKCSMEEAAEYLNRSKDSTARKASRMGLARPLPAAPPVQPTDKRLEREQDTNRKLRERMQQMIQTHDVPVIEYMGEAARWGVVSDPHLGSLWERPDLLLKAYEIMHQEGITRVFHAGDMCEGSGMRRGHEHEVSVVGADNQVKHVHDVYPQIEGMTTHFILGSHDLSFKVAAGHNIGERLAERKDLIYLGGETADVPIKIGETTVIVRIAHPGKGTSYALSYQPQKYIEALSGGRKPDILFLGHYHKALFMPMYRNVPSFLCGCLQSQTDWMRRGMLAAEMGFWIVAVGTTNQGLAKVTGTWYPFFEI